MHVKELFSEDFMIDVPDQACIGRKGIMFDCYIMCYIFGDEIISYTYEEGG